MKYREEEVKMRILEWISNWFALECNGDWEHENQIKIETSDNPGWIIQIDLRNTPWENFSIEYILHENSEDDWFGYSIKNKKFEASGDLSKLEFLLNKFRSIIENNPR